MIKFHPSQFWLLFLLAGVVFTLPLLAAQKSPANYPVRTFTPPPSTLVQPTATPFLLPSNTPVATHTATPSNAFILLAGYRNDNNGDGVVNNQDRGAIFLMNEDGSNVRQITSSNLDASDPDISPDRRSIVFSDFSRNSAGDLYILDLQTSDIRFLTVGSNPTWSPDGQYIAFTCDGESNPDICILDINGTNYRRLTNAGVSEANWQPHWSPTSDSLYFISRRVDTTGDGIVVGCDNALVVRIDFDTLQQTIVSSTSESISSISVSRDGQLLLLTEVWEYSPSADGRRCGWNDASEIEVLDLKTGRIDIILPRHALSRQPVFALGDTAILYLTSWSDYNNDGAVTIVDARVLTLYDFSTGTTIALTDDHYQWFDIRWIE